MFGRNSVGRLGYVEQTSSCSGEARELAQLPPAFVVGQRRLYRQAGHFAVPWSFPGEDPHPTEVASRCSEIHLSRPQSVKIILSISHKVAGHLMAEPVSTKSDPCAGSLRLIRS